MVKFIVTHAHKTPQNVLTLGDNGETPQTALLDSKYLSSRSKPPRGLHLTKGVLPQHPQTQVHCRLHCRL